MKLHNQHIISKKILNRSWLLDVVELLQRRVLPTDEPASEGRKENRNDTCAYTPNKVVERSLGILVTARVDVPGAFPSFGRSSSRLRHFFEAA